MNPKHVKSSHWIRAQVGTFSIAVNTVIRTFVLRIYKQMKLLGLRKQDLAKRMAVSPASVSHLLNGKNYTVETMVKAAQALNCELTIVLEPRDSTQYELIPDFIVYGRVLHKETPNDLASSGAGGSSILSSHASFGKNGRFTVSVQTKEVRITL